MGRQKERPCLNPSCSATTLTGYCSEHTITREKLKRQWVGTAKERGYDQDWKKIRLKALERDCFLCVMCLEQDQRMCEAHEVDHIVPIKTNPALRLELSNLQSLCRPHHRKKTWEEQNQQS